MSSFVTDPVSAAATDVATGAPAATPAEALLMIAAAPDRETMLQVTTDQARLIIGAHQSVTSLTIDDSWSQAITAISLSDKYDAWRSYDERPNGTGIYQVVCRTNRPMRMTQSELERHAGWRGFGDSAARHPPMRGWLAAPLVGGDGRNLGLIQLSDKYEGDFTAEDEAVLIQLARLASVAIEKARAEDALKISLENLHREEEKLHLLAQQLVMVREEERKRLSLDLHDNVCQDLVGISILVDSARQRLRGASLDVGPELARAARYLSEVVEHLRRLARDLRPMQLRDLGLEGSLQSLAAGASSSETAVVAAFSTPVPRLAEATEIAVYRVAQEALGNALRHARARSVVMTLTVTDGVLRLEVTDDGRGIDAESRPAAPLGIASMEERALALGGRFSLVSRAGHGTTMRFECPLTTA